MMKRLLFFSMAAVSIGILGGPVLAQDTVVRGYLVNGHAYAATLTEPKESKACLVYGNMASGEVKTTIGCRYSIPPVNRWRIYSNKLWLITRMNDSPRWDGFFRIEFSGLLNGKLQWGPASFGDPYNFLGNRWGPISNQDIISRFVEFKLVAHYDLLPITDDTLRLFMLRNTDAIIEENPKEPDRVKGDMEHAKWNFKILKYRARWGENPLAPKHMIWLKGDWTEEESLQVAFKGSFHVFALAKGYGFVTDAGQSYFSPPVGQGERKIRPLWTDPAKRITHVITDVDQNKTYAFGKFRVPVVANKTGFFFQLDSDVRPHYFDPVALKPVMAEEPLRSIMQFGQLLAQEEGKVKADLGGH